MYSILKRLKRVKTKGLGDGLKGGDEHYRAYVGPPEDYDLIAAMTFNLVTCAGLRQQHKLLDIGCGSLRLGRLLIPYLEKGHYIGVEPNRWLVDDGIGNETGHDLIRLKKPRFSFSDNLQEFDEPLELDYAVAQSIFSHTSELLFKRWLEDVSRHLKPSGALFATFKKGDASYSGAMDWIYPGTVQYTSEKVEELAKSTGFACHLIDWSHPRQQWVLFSKPDFDMGLLDGDRVSWNHRMKQYLSNG